MCYQYIRANYHNIVILLWFCVVHKRYICFDKNNEWCIFNYIILLKYVVMLFSYLYTPEDASTDLILHFVKLKYTFYAFDMMIMAYLIFTD
jgi:hypothetical protein